MALKKIAEFFRNSCIRTHWISYLAGFILVIGIKYFYSQAGCRQLQWILAPTAWWVRTLSGIPFEYDPDAGYINYDYRFIIASSCSGVRFMILSTAALLFSFVHRMRTSWQGAAWTAFSLAFSYAATVFINGIRITASIYIPGYARQYGLYDGWLTPGRLHTAIGIAIYFSSLFALYRMADHASGRIAPTVDQSSPDSPMDTDLQKRSGAWLRDLIFRCVPPVFWYYLAVLIIPILNRAYEHDTETFVEYAMLLTVICTAILCLLCIPSVLWKIRHKRRP